jgi:hypothetical protein
VGWHSAIRGTCHRAEGRGWRSRVAHRLASATVWPCEAKSIASVLLALPPRMTTTLKCLLYAMVFSLNGSLSINHHHASRRNRKALAITEAELKVMAAAAIKRMPAATGTPWCGCRR